MNISDILKKNQELKSIHGGKRCFILGNGPSTDNQDLLLLENEIKIVVNAIYNHEKIKEINPNYWLCVDPVCFEKREKYLIPLINAVEEKEMNVKMFFPINYVHGKGQIQGTSFLNLHYLNFDASKTIDEDIDFTQGVPIYAQNVILVAMMLAFYLGCNPIYLLGCEHTWWKFTREGYDDDSAVNHSYEDNSENTKFSDTHSYDFLQTTIYVQKFQYLQLMKYAEKRGIQIFNATDGGYLNLFPRVKYEDLFPSGTRSTDTKSLLSAMPDISSVLGKSAIKLMNQEEWPSALVLLDEAVAQNINKASKTEGLDYLRSVCMMNLGEPGEAIKAARQDYFCNPSNRENALTLLKSLEDDFTPDTDIYKTPHQKTFSKNSICTAHTLGTDYISDDLSIKSANKTPLKIATNLKNPGDYGRNTEGWFVKGGKENGYLYALANSGIPLGNRSIFAKLDFISTQDGTDDGNHGIYEIRLIHNEEWVRKGCVPMSVCINNGRFYIVDIYDNVIAGDNETPVFKQEINKLYTISVVLFQKSIYAYLNEAGISHKKIHIGVPDCKRYLPGFPGFGLMGNPHAKSGRAIVKNWLVSPIGPHEPIIGAIGDSITAGLPEFPENESYVHIVTRAIGQPLTLNAGSGGANFFLDLKRFPIEIAPFKPYIVWIEGGTNDIIIGASAEVTYQNIMRQINLITWGGIPLLSTVPPNNTNTDEKNNQLNTLNNLIRNSGYAYIDRNAILRTPDKTDELNPIYNNGDGIHINPAGNKKIADEAIKVIKSLSQWESIRAAADPGTSGIKNSEKIVIPEFGITLG